MPQNQIPSSDRTATGYQPQPGYPAPKQAPNHPAAAAEPARFSAMAIAGLVLGVVGLTTSFLPILNNISFFIALLGAIFAIVGIVAGVRRTRRGKGLAIAALIVSVAACVAVLWTQSIYSQAIDAVTTGDQAVGASQAAPSGSEGAQTDYSNLAVGDAVELESGLKVAVTAIGTQENYDGSTLVVATVSYENAGTENASYNPFDWESQNANGAQTSCTFYGGDNSLSSGTLIPGGTVSGDVYFQGDAVKLLYSSSLLADSVAAWNVA